MRGANPLSPPALEWEASQLLERMQERLEEREPEIASGEGSWHDDQKYHVESALSHLEELRYRSTTGLDYDEAMTEAADAVNHVVMALSNIEQEPPKEESGEGVE